MTNMLEKVARAIHGASLVAMPWDSLNNAERDIYRAVARAAIDPMQEEIERLRGCLEQAARIAETPISGEQDDITMAAKDRVAAAIRATL